MRPPRINFVGAVYHVTVRCNNREFFFQDDEDFLLFLEILLQAKKIYKIHIYAYCITNNHVHLLFETPHEPNISKFMQYLNGNFAKAYNKRHGKSGRFWGGRFHSTVIESDTQLFNTIFYIEFNLVRCRAVDDPGEWRWSSYRAHAFGEEDPVLDFHDLYLQLAATTEERQKIYQEMAANYIQERGLQKDPLLSSGIIVGSRDFVENILGKYEKIDFYQRHQAHPFEDTYSICYRSTSPPPDS